jgi:integrase
MNNETHQYRQRRAGNTKPSKAPYVYTPIVVEPDHLVQIDLDRTVSDACTYWLEHRTSKKRSDKDDRSIIKVHIRPLLGNLSLADLRMVHTDAFTTHLIARGLRPKTQRNIQSLLASILKLAADLDWIPKAPKVSKTAVVILDQDFRYLRTEGQIAQFLSAAKYHSPQLYMLYKTAVYTGLRAGELAGLHWADVDLDKRLITVRRSHDKPTKNGRIRYVYINDVLLPDLSAWADQASGPIVFPTKKGTQHQKSARVFQEYLHQTLKRAQLAPVPDTFGQMKPFITFHDLRHTFASHWVMNGGDLYRLQKTLGHQSAQMTSRYAHLDPSTLAKDHDLFPSPESPGPP